MKRIITCSDGTWNKPTETDDGVIAPTNVYLLSKLIAEKGKDGVAQMTFYDEGVGTKWYDKIPGGMFGIGINQNIVDAYMYIVKHYEPGDEIYLFGFSRGAYTARSVAGLIRNSGLLKPENEGQIQAAFQLYRRRDDASHPSEKEATEFRAKYCYPDVHIKFIGVWDTVGALGVPLKWFHLFNKDVLDCQFHDVSLSSSINHAFHAVAIDEHRKQFLPTLWKQQAKAKENGQVMEQRWFTGVHSDVGGGYSEHGLSDCALAWLIEKAQQLGLTVDDSGVNAPNPTDQMHKSMNFLYKLLGSVNRQINNGVEYNETISPSVITRLEANTDNYAKKANPNLLKKKLIG